jgi:hypothetical protein
VACQDTIELSYFYGFPSITTIGAGFVIVRLEFEWWPFSINLETTEASPPEEGIEPLVYECELPWPPALHACLDR